MPEVTAFPPGWPSWVELHSPHLGLSKDFYTGLFGWDSYTMTLSGFGDCEVFTLGGVQGPEVAGMHALADDTQPPSWTCYFRSDDVQGTVECAQAAGGQELVPPFDFSSLGHMAMCSDPQGADFALWTPYDLPGAGVVDEPSAMCWVELACRDTGQARRFYRRVFGWDPEDRGYAGTRYTEFRLGESPVAGMVEMDEGWPADHPAHWIPYFQVADCDATAARAVERGARMKAGPADDPTGRFAIMTDPTGARLGIITPPSADRARPRRTGSRVRLRDRWRAARRSGR